MMLLALHKKKYLSVQASAMEKSVVMGMIVSVEADNGERCPDWFTQTDSKRFARALIEFSLSDPPLNPLAVAAKQFNLDLTLLSKYAGQDFGPEEFLDSSQYELANEQNEAAWQKPDLWIACLQSLTEALDTNPQMFFTVPLSPDWQDSYLGDGYFQQDVKDLLHIIMWHKKNGAGRVRLILA